MDGFRPIRRDDRDLGEDVAMEILRNGYSGTLCVMGADGYPYGVPMNYILAGNEILFHCSSQAGHLLESIDDGCRACFTVSERMEGVRSRSAIAFGDVRVDDTRLAEALNGIVDKYVPEPGRESARMDIPQASGKAVALVMGIAHASTKVVDKPAGR